MVLRNIENLSKATELGSFVWLSLTVKKLISAREAPNPCINIGSALLIEGENCLTNVSLTCRKIATSLRCSICPWCNGSTAVSKTVRSRFESLGACHLYIRPWCTAHVSPVQTSRKIGVQFPRGLAKALTVACHYCLVDTPSNEYVTAARRKLCELDVGATTM